MDNLILSSATIGIVISLLAYEIGLAAQRKWKLAILNPLLISIALVIVFLVVFHVDYDSYNMSAKYLSYLLTPATVCLAIPLYLQLDLLKKNIGPAQQCREVRDTVSSLRLDNVLAAGFSISRGKAAEAVEKGAAQVNWTVCQKPDKPVAAGDTITCRGLGKCVLDSVGGPTKKGRLPVVIRRFV